MSQPMALRLEGGDRAVIEVISVARYGQISGTTHVNNGQPDDRSDWPNLVDATGAPLLTDTGRWGVIGVDEGANAWHSDGRLYFFFGDVATNQSGDPPENSDLVAWTDEHDVLTHGGHQALGLNFQLPQTGVGVAGQDKWQFCLKCSALFWNGDPTFKGSCPNKGGHDTFGLGFDFTLPFEPTPIAGQPQWRFCVRCAALFWEGDPATPGTCPAGGTHRADGLHFVIPTTPAASGGQPDWRFCVRCHGLFWDGEASKGLCTGSPGGGIHLRAVTRDGQQTGTFDHFRAPDGSPIRYTGTVETPNGAYSFDDVMYVFAGIAAERWSHMERPENPAYGAYLFSKGDPSEAGPWNVELLFSPRLGWCASDETRSSFDSHNVLGNLFVVGYDLPESADRLGGFRCCRKCAAVYRAAGQPGGACQRGGTHELDPAVPDELSFEIGANEDEQHQTNWRTCSACLALYWAGDSSDTGLCPAAGRHQPSDPMLRLPHVSTRQDGTHQAHWRFCSKCSGIFWNGDDTAGICPRDHQPHQRAGYDFLLGHHRSETAGTQGGWRLCAQCSVLYSERAPVTACPTGIGVHTAIGWEFVLDVASQETPIVQPHWRRCVKCAGLYFDGFADTGSCPSDESGHTPDPAEPELQLPHNPGVDANNRGNLQFCLRCHGLVRTDQPTDFPWVAPVVVDNARHAVLPSRDGTGLVLIGFDWRNFRLAWMPLVAGMPPRLETVQYFHTGHRKWSDETDDSAGYELFPHPFPGQYTHVSALWLDPPGCWVVAYALAWDVTKRFEEPIVARFSTDLLTWSAEVPLFHPRHNGAYGAWMHDPKIDEINPKAPPAQPPGQDNPGWAYGAFLIDRFTTYDPNSRILDLHYLMSTASPYQVQLVHTVLRLPDPVVEATGPGAAADAQRLVVDTLDATAPAPGDPNEIVVLRAEARQNLIVRLLEAGRPADAAAVVPAMLNGYRGYVGAGGDLPRVLHELGDPVKPLLNAHLISEALAVTRAQVELLEQLQSPDPAAQVAHRLELANARHNVVARLLDAGLRDEAATVATDVVAGYLDYAAQPGADRAETTVQLRAFQLVVDGGGLADASAATSAAISSLT